MPRKVPSLPDVLRWNDGPSTDYRSLVEQFFSASERGILIVADRRRVVYLNVRARDMLGYEGPVGEPIGKVLHDVDLEFAVGDVMHDRKPVSYESYAPHPDRLLHCQLIPITARTGEPVCVVMAFDDVTRLRHLETVRRDFVANVSHELRTPITSINLLTETLQNGALSDPAAAAHFVQRIQVETVSLTRLVEELLELSKLESGRLALNLASIVPADALNHVAHRLEPAAREKHLSVSVEVGDSLPAVTADPERLEQILMNLTHNAIKFTPEGGQVTLRATRHGRGVAVEVIDNGIGMTAAEAARVFERFYKVDRGRSRGGGTGLGLAVARHLLELHGTRLQVVSEPGRGSRFSFALPPAPPSDDTAEEADK